MIGKTPVEEVGSSQVPLNVHLSCRAIRVLLDARFLGLVIVVPALGIAIVNINVVDAHPDLSFLHPRTVLPTRRRLPPLRPVIILVAYVMIAIPAVRVLIALLGRLLIIYDAFRRRSRATSLDRLSDIRAVASFPLLASFIVDPIVDSAETVHAPHKLILPRYTEKCGKRATEACKAI